MKSYLGVFSLWLGLVLACSALEVVGPIQVASAESSAVVTWKTDTPAGTRIQIRPSTGRQTNAEKSPDTKHSVTVEGLQPGTTYTVDVGTARVWVGTTTFTTSGTPPKASAVTKEPRDPPRPASSPPPREKSSAPPARQTWGNLASLQDHFDRHGADFNAKNPEDYARLAWEFLQRAKSTGLPAKLEDDGVLRVFDPKTRAFAAYNRDGTTKTFFKVTSRDYFERQPGRYIDLKVGK
jgi:hypothetical protein